MKTKHGEKIPKLTIVLATDHHEGDEFAAWLERHGHRAEVGNDTDNHVTGSDDPEILNYLWDCYCNE